MDTGIGIELQRVIGLLRRQARLIAAITLSLAVLVALVIFQLTPIFEASALLIVDPRQTNMLDPQSQVSLLPGDTGRVESEVGMVQSSGVLLAVIQQLRLTSAPEFSSKPGMRDWIRKVAGIKAPAPSPESILNKTLEALQSAVSVERRGLTYLIDIKARSPDPKRAAELANAVANAHIQLQIAAKIAVASGIRGALQQEASQTGASLGQAEARLKEFYDRAIQSVEDPVRAAELVELRRQAESSEAKRRNLESTVASATLALNSADWQSVVDQLQSDSLRRLNEDRTKLIAKMQSNADVDLRSELAALETQMQSEAKTAIDQAQQSAFAESTSGSELENTFRQQLIAELPPESVAELRQLQQEALASSAVYENLVSREKAVAAQQNLQVPDSRIVANAIPPGDPVYPRKKLIIGLAGLGAFALAVGIAFLRENYVGGFVSEEQTESVLGIPVFSSVPVMEGANDHGDFQDHAKEIVDHPLSSYSESIRRTRLGLEAAVSMMKHEPKSSQVILVTSTLPNEGKTQTAISLARSYAMAGRRVLLIDADLRRPTVHKAVGVERDVTLPDALSRASDAGALTNLAFKDDLSSAWIIPGSAVRSGGTAELLESEHIGELLSLASSRFEVILIDSSPLLPVVDARLLVRFANVVVMVVRWAQTSQHDTRAALQDLLRHNHNGAVVGAVLNRVERSAFSYGYGRYYAPYYLE